LAEIILLREGGRIKRSLTVPEVASLETMSPATRVMRKGMWMCRLFMIKVVTNQPFKTFPEMRKSFARDRNMRWSISSALSFITISVMITIRAMTPKPI
jgi:hypothetical protein